MTKLPTTLRVAVNSIQVLSLSEIRYAVTLQNNNIVALFRWLDRAEIYRDRYAMSEKIIDLQTGQTYEHN